MPAGVAMRMAATRDCMGAPRLSLTTAIRMPGNRTHRCDRGPQFPDTVIRTCIRPSIEAGPPPPLSEPHTSPQVSPAA